MTKENQLYELGYHILPTVSGDKVEGVVKEITQILTDAGAEIGAGEEPELRDLAYPMDKKLDAKKRTYTSAYFGWMNFTTQPSSAEEIQEKLRDMGKILRFLVVKKDEEVAEKEEKELSSEEDSDENAGTEENAQVESSKDEQIDKAIDTMVKE